MLYSQQSSTASNTQMKAEKRVPTDSFSAAKRIKLEKAAELRQTAARPVAVPTSNGTNTRESPTENTKSDSSDSSDDNNDSDSGSDSGSSSDDDEDSSEEDESEEEQEASHFDQAVDLKVSYNKLQHEIKGQNAEIARVGGVKLVSENITKANQLFSQMRRSQGSAIMATDSATLKQIGYQAVLATRNLRLGASERGLDFKDFVAKITAFLQTNGQDEEEYEQTVERNDRKFNNDFNWLKLGALYSRTSRRAATTEFLQGTLQIEQKTRNLKPRQAEDANGETVRATALSAADVKPNEDKETSKNVERSYQVLHNKAHGQQINFFKFMIDPTSFARSVENLFYTSFLISHGLLTLLQDEDGVPALQEASPGVLEELKKKRRGEIKKSQIIFRLDYSDWQGLIERFNITESFL
ncbi:unnamed protein product [Kuraishia capsulata CBS 1993]|uniref:Non-structural maintenance of chromosomes element 4 n=1 Tax=Kuraishia capsulata CBS 1993 TaxID=1382522 RepID=W6MLS5_9ASCO|nr:uncharacterized protein KUCA_T00003452001 [Kuraishia capsulata CBS 1993]CDK27474.1 unnamed protein product [Kuraishia capsulata CBS 1993]